MKPPLLSLRDVHVGLGGNAILREVSADIARGQITALIGPNGCGKTTLLRSILKEVPYAGEIRFHCGHDHSKPAPEHIGYVPQKLNIDVRLPLTVLDLLAMSLHQKPLFLGVNRKTRKMTEELLARVYAPPELLDRPVEKISGGELQRVLLGLALQLKPELLLLDEPAAGIDFQTQKKFYDLLAELNRTTGVTILLVSHELTVVSEHAHHVLCLKDGRIQCQGPPTVVLTGENLMQTFGLDMAVFSHHHHH